MGRTQWGTGSEHRLLGNQSTHSADKRHNGWDCWCRHVDRHHYRAGNTERRNTPCQRSQAGWSGHHNDHLHVRSPGVGHHDHKRNMHRPDWCPPPPTCIQAGPGPGRTGAARRGHTVPDGPRLSGGVPRLNSVGVATLTGRIATWGDFRAVARARAQQRFSSVWGDGNHALFHHFQTGGGLMARQIFVLLAAAVGTGTYMDKRQVEGVVHLEVFVGIEHAAQILQ